MVFRAVHPLYGIYLMDYLGKADANEVIQIMESLLAMPPAVARYARVPWADRMPPGPLATEIVDPGIVGAGLVRAVGGFVRGIFSQGLEFGGDIGQEGGEG